MNPMNYYAISSINNLSSSKNNSGPPPPFSGIYCKCVSSPAHIMIELVLFLLHDALIWIFLRKIWSPGQMQKKIFIHKIIDVSSRHFPKNNTKAFSVNKFQDPSQYTLSLLGHMVHICFIKAHMKNLPILIAGTIHLKPTGFASNLCKTPPSKRNYRWECLNL